MIRSFVGTSLIEYPGKVCSVIFLGGCNLYCPFCHNPELVRPDLLADQLSISPDSVIERLRARQGFVEAVTVTGGEPLIQEGLPDFLASLRKQTPLAIKIDTNGTLPERMPPLEGLVDYLAIDVKASPDRYPEATGGHDVFDRVLRSIAAAGSFPAFELRTTMVPGLIDRDGLMDVLDAIGIPVARYVLQPFRPQKTLSPEYEEVVPYPVSYLEECAEAMRARVAEVEVRS
ncbi:anaerobic ribonucleoside-triphosphate reductase activating protein [Candidatus Fermentibacterales bacterium]|nr:anaerobic ribonucleoside-triphosphate reductase activating protein [Candidatus Fermentibacterales bacterium]